MSLAQVLSSYLNMNLLIVVGFSGVGLFALIVRRIQPIKASTELQLHYITLSIIIGLSLIHPFLPDNKFFSPAAKVWSAQSIKTFSQEYSIPDKSGYLSIATPRGFSTLPAEKLVIIWEILATLLFALGGLFIARVLHTLFKIKNESYLIRKSGNVLILANDTIQVPFSYWTPGQAHVVVPSSLLEQPLNYKMAIAHELQHHRHGDTRWVYVMWGMRLFCILNPVIHFWNRWISEIQEFACDETLVDRNKVESQAYARCLVEVAQLAIYQKLAPVCATGLMFLVERNLLKRRIEKMLSKSSTRIGRSISVSVGIVLALILGATAFASKGLVQDRRINRVEADEMAARARTGTGFPIVVNDLVLKQLNRYIGTPEGREFMRDSLRRMESYKVTIDEFLERYGVPPELLAIPIIESGYQNLTEALSGTPMKAAGLWQFIASTAGNFDLHVNSQKDERLDVGLSTDAAVRLLKSDQLRFKDWSLAVLAYNMGETAVQKGIDATGSRDAWTLIRNGYEGDKDYLPRLIAAILVMKNPESVN